MIVADKESIALDRAYAGDTLGQIAEFLKIDRRTLYEYRRRNPSFAAALDDGLIAGAYSEIEAMKTSLLNDLSKGGDPMTARVKLEVLKFYLEKRFPREFAIDRKQVSIAVVDLRPAIDDAKRKLAQRQVIDITPQSSTVSTDQVSVGKVESAELLARMLE